jgi:hypothetical protein
VPRSFRPERCLAPRGAPAFPRGGQSTAPDAPIADRPLLDTQKLFWNEEHSPRPLRRRFHRTAGAAPSCYASFVPGYWWTVTAQTFTLSNGRSVPGPDEG